MTLTKRCASCLISFSRSPSLGLVCCPPPQSATRAGVENKFLTCPVSAGVRLSPRGQQGGVPQAGHWPHPGQNCGGREVQSGMPSPSPCVIAGMCAHSPPRFPPVCTGGRPVSDHRTRQDEEVQEQLPRVLGQAHQQDPVHHHLRRGLPRQLGHHRPRRVQVRQCPPTTPNQCKSGVDWFSLSPLTARCFVPSATRAPCSGCS